MMDRRKTGPICAPVLDGINPLPFNYLAESVELVAGILVWRARPETHFKSINAHRRTNTRFAGKDVKLQVKADGTRRFGLLFGGRTVFVRAHRAIWALQHGRWPLGLIDHINGDRSDNRPSNLREVDHALNSRNQACVRQSAAGHVGVYLQDGKWRARIGVGRQKVAYLGIFDNRADAIAARKSAEKKLGYTERHAVEFHA